MGSKKALEIAKTNNLIPKYFDYKNLYNNISSRSFKSFI